MKRVLLAAVAAVALGGAGLEATAQQASSTDPAILDSTLPNNVVCSGQINHRIQESFDGTYVKWETGEISDGASIPGANFDAYAVGGKLGFFWPNSSNGNAGVAATADGTDWLVLQLGDQIGPDSVFSQEAGAAANWIWGVDGHLGFKFNCSTAGTCYGYAHIISSGPNGHPATLADYCFDSAGDAITIEPNWIFRSGFESGESVVTGILYHGIPKSFQGTEVKWETGEISDGASLPGANFNAYAVGGKLAFFWPNSGNGNAGVAATLGGEDWLVLQSGDQVGPGSIFSDSAGAATNWTPGADGYLGFRFNCSTAGTCYGYVEILTTGPDGFPAVMLKYRYDSAGNAITIP